jgi:Ca2+-binding RTX toxin-like protein
MVNIPVAWNTIQAANAELSGTQNETSIIQLVNGNIVVAWVSDSTAGIAGVNPGKDVLGQIFDPLGNKLGGEFSLSNPANLVDDRMPQLAALPSGGFMLVYEEHYANNPEYSQADNHILVREFDSNGLYQTGSGGYAAIDLSGAGSFVGTPSIIASSATSVLVTYFQFDNSFLPVTADVYGRIYNSVTNTFSPAFQLFNAGRSYGLTFGFTGDQYDVDVLTNGNYVFIGRSFVDSGASESIIIMSPSGQRLFAQLLPHPDELQSRFTPTVSATDDGGFLVTWDMYDGSEIEFAKFNSAGTQQFFGVLQDTSGLRDPVIASLRDGSFVIVFDDNANDAMAVRHFSATGIDLGRYDFSITTNGAHDPQVVDLMDGRFAVSWSSGGTNAAFRIMDTRDNANSTSVYSPNSYQIGTIFNDIINTDIYAKYVYGHDGIDTIYESRVDTISYFGGEGDDTLVVASAINNDAHYGGNGVDTIVWFSQTQGAVFDLSFGVATASNGNVEVMAGFENLVGTNYADKISGTSGNNILAGHGGIDEIKGLSGNDKILGGSGHDILWGGSGLDTLEGGSGNDFLSGSFGTDSFVFNTALNAVSNVDTISTVSSLDKIILDNDIFTALGTAFTIGEFHSIDAGTSFAGVDTTDNIIYVKSTGQLFYDRDGSGTVYAPIVFAKLTANTTLEFSQFTLIE